MSDDYAVEDWCTKCQLIARSCPCPDGRDELGRVYDFDAKRRRWEQVCKFSESDDEFPTPETAEELGYYSIAAHSKPEGYYCNRCKLGVRACQCPEATTPAVPYEPWKSEVLHPQHTKWADVKDSYRERASDEAIKARKQIKRRVLWYKYRYNYVRALGITCGISLWFAGCLAVLGSAGYLVAVPTTAAVFAWQETRR